MIAAASLSGCAGTVYRTNLEVYCPPIQTYSTEWNEALAAELEGLSEGYTTIPQTLADYAALRDRIRVCEKEKDKL